MTSRETSDFLMMAMGAYTPLTGFMGYEDWRSCCTDMKLTNGLFWPIPITLSCSADAADSIAVEEDVALVDADSGEIMGALQVTEKYKIDKAFECQHVFRTTDPKHPGVAKVVSQGEVNLAGRVTALSEGMYPHQYKGLYLRPAETRALFSDKGWSRVAAFQTRNPMHRSHEHLAKIAIEVCDGILIHQVLGALKSGDIPAEVRVKAIDTLTEHYFVPGTYIQAGYPIEMRYGGPREALLHARPRRCRQLLWSVRRAACFRNHSARQSGYQPAQDRCDVFLLQVRWHGDGAHLSARRRGPASNLRNAAARNVRKG
jgi:sulfate adenylyltransferase